MLTFSGRDAPILRPRPRWGREAVAGMSQPVLALAPGLEATDGDDDSDEMIHTQSQATRNTVLLQLIGSFRAFFPPFHVRRKKAGRVWSGGYWITWGLWSCDSCFTPVALDKVTTQSSSTSSDLFHNFKSKTDRSLFSFVLSQSSQGLIELCSPTK